MKSIKTHFGVIISLVALLFSVQFGVFINNLIEAPFLGTIKSVILNIRKEQTC